MALLWAMCLFQHTNAGPTGQGGPLAILMTVNVDTDLSLEAVAAQPAYPGAVLHVDLGALAQNYNMFAEKAAPAECGAAIKGDAYGLGLDPVAQTLWDAGCKTFFVALTQEGLDLRAILPDAVIYVLNGLFPGAAETLAGANLQPVLS